MEMIWTCGSFPGTSCRIETVFLDDEGGGGGVQTETHRSQISFMWLFLQLLREKEHGNRQTSESCM